ncbi:MAG TPA: transcriptional regulator [Candidatus Caccomonas pullistercoris]|nr:transcriptional regulator [Candidatus Caccomonas pullistercoris]
MPEDSFTPKAEAAGAWCYLFVHYTKVELIRSKLNQKFNTFVHRSVTFKRVKGRIKKEVRPTISGLIFVQGNAREVEALLRSLSPALHLASDCTTGAVAQIADSVMQAFIQLSQFEPARIRFMPHALGYYATGHPLVRVTSGLLAGFEGYQVRISRDKCLVTSVGGMTVAIGGVCKETFENVEAYVNLRRSQQEDTADAAGQTPTQEAIGRNFFRPQNQMDLLALSGALAPWVEQAEHHAREGRYPEAAKVALILLDEVGRRLRPCWHDPRVGSFKDLDALCRRAASVLAALAASGRLTPEQHERLARERRALIQRHPFMAAFAAQGEENAPRDGQVGRNC